MTVFGNHTVGVHQASHQLGRWRTFWMITAILCLVSVSILLRDGDLVERLRLLIRTTARSSAALFLIAFTAFAIARLAPGGYAKWAVRDRRQIGLAFAFSHTIHAIAIYYYWRLAPELFWTGRSLTANLPGSIGYLAIALLVLTSNDRAMRLIGAKAWKKVHTVAMWAIFLVFLVAWGKRIPAETAYAIPFVIFAAAAVLRVAASRMSPVNVAREHTN